MCNNITNFQLHITDNLHIYGKVSSSAYAGFTQISSYSLYSDMGAVDGHNHRRKVGNGSKISHRVKLLVKLDGILIKNIVF